MSEASFDTTGVIESTIKADSRFKSRKLVFTLIGLVVHIGVFVWIAARQPVDLGTYGVFVGGLGGLIAVYTGGNVLAKFSAKP